MRQMFTRRRILVGVIVLFTLCIAAVFGPRFYQRFTMTTENHAFVTFNLCADGKYGEASDYVNRHPEVITHRMGLYKGTTLHFLATVNGDPKATKLFLDHGADVNATDDFGKTPLDYALMKNNISVALLLITSGGRFGKKDVELSPQELADRIKREFPGIEIKVDALRSATGT